MDSCNEHDCEAKNFLHFGIILDGAPFMECPWCRDDFLKTNIAELEAELKAKADTLQHIIDEAARKATKSFLDLD